MTTKSIAGEKDVKNPASAAAQEMTDDELRAISGGDDDQAIKDEAKKRLQEYMNSGGGQNGPQLDPGAGDRGLTQAGGD